MIWEPTKFIAVRIYNIAFCKWLPIGYPPPTPICIQCIGVLLLQSMSYEGYSSLLTPKLLRMDNEVNEPQVPFYFTLSPLYLKMHPKTS